MGYNYQYIERSSVQDALYFNTLDTMAQFIQRIIDTAVRSQSEWILLLEDDVWLYKPIKFTSLAFDLVGPCGWPVQDELRAALTHIRPDIYIPHVYQGCGGSVVRSSIFRQLDERPEEWRAWVETIRSQYMNILASDQLVAALVLLMNGTMSGDPNFVEVATEGAKDKLDEIAVLHRQKSLY
jgi:hypothetical protein